jgi:putative oxidoreductase
MSTIIKYLQLDFIPKCTDGALLTLRVLLCGLMIYAHGWNKLATFSENAASFPDPLHVGSRTSAVLAITSEVVCTAMMLLGVFTRPAVIGSMVAMSVAFFHVHGGRFLGANNGELAFLYLIGFLMIFIAGPGRFSIDAKLSK